MTQILLPLALLRLDGGTQSRAMTDAHTIARYAEAMEHGAPLPPLDAFYDGQEYWLADGFQRVAAARELEWDRILTDVHQGTRRDAILFSVGANTTHGRARSSDDTRRAVRKLLDDEEWRRWADDKIAAQTRVSHDYVRKLRAELYPASYAERNIRTVERGGTTYEMNVANMGRKPAQASPERHSAPVKPGHREREERPRFIATGEAMRAIVLAQSTLPAPEEAAVDDPRFDAAVARRIAGWWVRLADLLSAKAVRAG